MNTFRTTTEITPDHRLIVALPPEMPIGSAEVVVTVSPQVIVSPKDTVSPQNASATNGTSDVQGSFRKQFGSVRGGDPHAADNDRIDADLTSENHPTTR